VEAHLAQVWSVVARIVRRREDAEDVVQDVFVTAWRSIDGFRGDAKFSTWLHQIAVTRSLNHLARASERMRRSIAAPRRDGLDAGPEPLPEVERRASRHDTARRARGQGADAAIARLPAAASGAVDGRDRASRCRIDGLRRDRARSRHRAGTVRSRLARARIALRACVEGRPA
jgi:RNA polymerase sigma-70 factor (ECF subfamily)